MRFTKSKDGVSRTSIKVIVRATKEEVNSIRALLKKHKQDHSDKAIRQFAAGEAEEGFMLWTSRAGTGDES